MLSRLCRPLGLCLLLFLATGCNGGSGGSADPEADVTPAPPSPSAPDGDPENSGAPSDPGQDTAGSAQMVAPGEYAKVFATPNCPLIAGSESAPFTLVFADLDHAPFFDAIVQDAIANQFQGLAPFRDFPSSFAFYQTALADAEALGCADGEAGASFACDDDKVHQAILQQCEIDDIHGVIKVVIADAGYGASGGEVIYFGSDSQWPDQETALFKLRNLVVHEVGHNFGLADLYDGGTNADGSAATGWAKELARAWRNLDGPGCAKWCGGFKPASEYTQSSSAACHTFDNKDSCISYNRNEAGECTTDDGGSVECCTWSEDTVDDYFGTQCAPAWGTEDIGLDCLEGTGCYYGGAYGTNAWRPARSWPDSIMYGAGHSEAFDGASERELTEIIRCCGSSDDATQSCASFREKYVAFMADYQPYKQRLGSCGFN